MISKLVNYVLGLFRVPRIISAGARVVAMATNEAIPFYEDGDEITGHADSAITGKRFVKISATKQPGSTLTPSGADQTSGGNVRIAHADAAGRIFGVAGYDIPSGGKGVVKRGAGLVIPVTAAAAISAFQEVEVGANGQATPKAAGVAVGYSIADAASGTDAPINLYG